MKKPECEITEKDFEEGIKRFRLRVQKHIDDGHISIAKYELGMIEL